MTSLSNLSLQKELLKTAAEIQSVPTTANYELKQDSQYLAKVKEFLGMVIESPLQWHCPDT